MKKKKGMVSLHSGSAKMSKDEDSAPSADVRKQEIDDISRAVVSVRDQDTPSIPMPRRSARVKQLQGSCISRNGRTDKSSPQEETTASVKKSSAVNVNLKMRNRELENLVVDRGNSSHICDEVLSLTQPRESTAPLVKKEELSDNVAMLVHRDRTPQTSPEPKSLLEKNARELEKTSVEDVTTETSSQRENLTSDAPITDDKCCTSAMEASHEVTTSRRKMVDASQKAVMTTAPLEERNTGVTTNLLASEKGSSGFESESSCNDRSSNEDFDPTAKRRKSRSFSEFDSDRDDGPVELISSGINNQTDTSTPKESPAISATNTIASSSIDEDVAPAKVFSTDHVTNPKEPRRFECSVCAKQLASRAGLATHTLIHTGTKRYECSACGVRFTQCHHLKDHKRTHTGEKPFKCSFCDKSFAAKFNRVIHERIHTGERPFQCSFCGKRFYISSHLHKHERLHTGEKPYACSTCNKLFSDSSHRRKHERSHTNSNANDLPSISQKPTEQTSPKESNNLPHDTSSQKIRYRSKTIEHIIEKLTRKNPEKVYLVWSKKYSMDLAATVARCGRNCLLIVKKFNLASFPDVLNLSNMIHTCAVKVGPDAKFLHLLSFGGMILPEKMVKNNGYKSLAKLESKLKKFARSEGMNIVNVFKHSENNQGWYEWLTNNLKEDCIITDKV